MTRGCQVANGATGEASASCALRGFGHGIRLARMRIQFCGADRTVTGSCHLIEVNGLRLLLDCGMYQGARDEADRLNHYLPDGASKVDAVILSHGHLDHC